MHKAGLLGGRVVTREMYLKVSEALITGYATRITSEIGRLSKLKANHEEGSRDAMKIDKKIEKVRRSAKNVMHNVWDGVIEIVERSASLQLGTTYQNSRTGRIETVRSQLESIRIPDKFPELEPRNLFEYLYSV